MDEDEEEGEKSTPSTPAVRFYHVFHNIFIRLDEKCKGFLDILNTAKRFISPFSLQDAGGKKITVLKF